MKIVVPMAGRGSRFLDAANLNPEYKKPKPIINIKGKPMVAWAIDSLPFIKLPGKRVNKRITACPQDLIFICRRDHEEEHQISKVLKKLFTDGINIIFIDHITRGAAETVLKAKEYINNNEDIIISDSDHHFNGLSLYKSILYKDKNTEGIIPVLVPPDKEIKWSYTLFNKKRIASAVSEKDPVLAAKGAYANIGAYYFSKGKTFVNEAEEMIRENDMYGPDDKKEFYIAPIYNRLIKKGMKIKVSILPKVWNLGAPKDVQYFLDNYPNGTI
ncbi:MAG TPA: sugar phosphate nucleotidyltransferase [Patescibacteria group bacterium]